MKVSLNLAQRFSNVELKSISHEELLARVGAQLGAVEESIEWAPKYKGIVVVKIVSSEQHPDADRLHVCMVDDGGVVKNVERSKEGLVQVVCGAANALAGIYVAWLPPGSTVPSSLVDAEPFVLGARELRGVVSNGMLASAREMGINDDHDGILEISPEEVGKTPKPGEPITAYFGLDDFIIDCENKMFTHRPDCFGNLGVARELAGISGKAFKSPDWYLSIPKFERPTGVKLTVKNEAGKLVPRLMAVAMKGISVSKSPIWLQASLIRVGIKSINNVVDISNFIMHLTGQPLHAYDADKLGLVLTSRMAKKGEKVALLNGKTIELTVDDIVIANSKKVVGLAGIMGGVETEVDETTKNIIIECATFDMYTIRRSSMRHGLFTDASTRYTKGQSPLQNDRALWYALKNMFELAGAKQSSMVYDVHGKLLEPADVVVSPDFINARLGSRLNTKDISKLLENVEFVIKAVPADKNNLHIKPPFWRTDVEESEDVVEEVGRLYGFDKLPVELPARISKPVERNEMMDFKQSLRASLAAAGANEVLTYSFVHGDLMRKTNTNPEKVAYHLRNALSPDLQYFRTSLMPSLLDKVNGNIRADLVRGDDNEFALFEIGKAHVKGKLDDEKLPAEMEHLALVFAADEKTAKRKYSGSALYQAKQYLLPFACQAFEFEPLETLGHPMSYSYQLGRSALIKVKGEVVGVVGEIDINVKKAFKLPDFCAGFEIDIQVLWSVLLKRKYRLLGLYPKIQQDLTFEVSGDIPFSTVYVALAEGLQTAGLEHGYESIVVPHDIFQADGAQVKRLSFRLWISHPKRTLETSETNKLIATTSSNLKDQLGVERI